MTAVAKLEDLLSALDWVNSEHQAYVSRETGRVFWTADDGTLAEDEELPPDLEDEDKYLPVPDKRDLDLGSRLPRCFIEEHLPDEAGRVSHFFSKPGAYSRFKSWLDEIGQLDAWFAYEQAAAGRAIREWAIENGLEVSSQGEEDAQD